MFNAERISELLESLKILAGKDVNSNYDYFITKHQDHFRFLDSLGFGTAICDYNSGKFYFTSEKFLKLFSVKNKETTDYHSIISRLVPEDEIRVKALLPKGYRFISELQTKQQNGCEMRIYYRVKDEHYRFKWIIQSSRFIIENNNLFEIICVNIGCEDQMEPPEYLNIVYGNNRKCFTIEPENITLISFSEREKEVLFWSLKALSVKQIAETLFISSATVRFHRKNILGKLGMKNFIQVMNYHQNLKRG